MKNKELQFKNRMRILSGILFVFIMAAFSFMGFDALMGGGIALMAAIPAWIVDGNFKELTPEEVDKLELEDQGRYFLAMQKNYQDKLDEKIKNKASAEDIQALKDSLDQLKSSHFKTFETILETHGKSITKILNNMQLPELTFNEKSQINKFLADNTDKIVEMFNQGHGFIEFETKAVSDMTTGSATNPDGIPELAGVQAAPPTNVNLRGVIVDALTTSFNTNLSAYPYTESVPKDGDYSFVAEGGSKPQIDFKVETRWAEPKKVAAHMVLTEESVTDIPGLQSIATNYLRAKHDLKRQNGILFGDGVGANLKGATVYGRTFVAGGMANAVTNPNFMNVVNACITDIYTTHNYTDEMPYMANLVMINPVDFYLQLVSAKDANGLPLYPMAGLFNRVVIGGVTIVPFENIPTGKIFVSDMSKYNTTNYVPYTVRIGWINDQFITNKFTMVGESRLHGFVKKLDEQAFIYDTIATIEAAIKKP